LAAWPRYHPDTIKGGIDHAGETNEPADRKTNLAERD
jgi:hypothetical protein